jgi:hypothetical protein
MEAGAELELLLADLLDGEPGAARNERLADLLRAHPELQQEYLDHLQLHALLRWRAGKIVPPDSVPEQRTTEPAPAKRPHWLSRPGVAATLVFLAASLAAFFLLRIPTARATPDLVERLADWNLELTEAPRDERNRIYDEQAVKLRATLAKTALTPEDRKLAETLLEGASLLTRQDDPMAQADYFTGLADQLVAQIEVATNAGDEKRIVQLADIYGRLTEVGVDANLEKARASGKLDNDNNKKIEGTARKRDKRLEEIIARNPEPSRGAIHRAMKKLRHKKKH